MGHDLFTPIEARKLIRAILDEGETLFTSHAREEMANDDISEEQVLATLRGGVVDEAEWRGQEWRHHVRTQSICVVVSIESTEEQVIVTVWSLKKQR